jgi:hypothetical protein
MQIQSRQRFLAVVMFALASAVRLAAQAPGTGAIAGTVHDPSGLVLGNAAVTVRNLATDAARTTVTGPAGGFAVTLLPPGTYAVKVVANGFAEGGAASVAVVTGETSTLEVKLALAQVGISLQVSANASIAQTESSTLGRAVDERAMEALPLANRNYTQLLGLSPGVVVPLPDATALGRNNQNVTANGAKTTSNNLQFNGVDANNLAQDSAEDDGEESGVAVPAPDAIAEFKVQTANYDAGYGRGAGANVDLVSRTGTKQWHGSAWEFVRNNILNANDFFSKHDKQPKPTLKQNQFGASLGGPLLKDRTFIFLAYQGLRSSNGSGGETTVTLPQLTADRSAKTLGAQFCPAGHGNAAGYQTNAGGLQVACDGSNINPAAIALLNFKLANGQYAVPSPQVKLPGTDPTQIPLGQSTFAPAATYREDQATVNLDQVLTAKNTLAARFFYSIAPTVQPFSPNAANVPGWGTQQLQDNMMTVLSDTHVASANLVNVARFGYMRFDGLSSVQNPIAASDVGIGTPTGLAGVAPGVSIGGLFTTGDAGTPSQWQNTNSFIAQDTLSWMHGRHSLRMGLEAKRHRVDVNAPFSTDGLLFIATFDDFLLGQSAAQNGSPSGISNVLGSNGSSGIFRRDERSTDAAAFVQDDVRISQRLTVNAGLRYEVFGPPNEIHGFLPSFNPEIATATVPAAGSLSGYTLPANFGGTIPQGVTRSSTSALWATDYADVSPRVGFALQLTSRPVLVLRGGYGMYFDHPSGGFAESTIGQQPFAVQTFQFNAQNAGSTLQQPFAPLLPLRSSFPIYQPRVPGGGTFTSGVSTHVRDPRTQEYNVNLQFAPGADYLVEVGYVGARTTQSAGSRGFNQALLASPAHPVNGETTNTAANLSQRLPFQGIGAGSLFSETAYRANYNALESSITKRFAHGFQFLGSYTWSKILDETSGSGGSTLFQLWLVTNDQNNPRQAYGLTDFDHDQRGVVSFVWTSPSLGSAVRPVRLLLNGWELSGIGVIQSGSPLTILDSNAGLVYGNLENRAQRATGPVSTRGSLSSRAVNGYLNASAFTAAPEAPFGSGPGDTDFGNSSTGLVRGPGQHNMDLAVERGFAIREAGSLHFRAEFFNVTNTPEFANPNNSVNYTAGPGGPVNLNPGFGLITAKAANPRIIQLALRYSF